MTNLIPPEGKKMVRTTYWLRVLTVWSFLWGGIMCALILTLIPTYVFLEGQRAHMTNANPAGSNEALSDDARGSIRATMALVGRLDEAPPLLTLASLVEGVNEVTPDSIVLAGYRVVRTGTAVAAITIEGSAASREALFAFQRALEDHALFETAQVPLGDLVRDRDLPFSITVTVAPQYAK